MRRSDGRMTQAWISRSNARCDTSSGGAKDCSPRREPSGKGNGECSPGTGRKTYPPLLFRPVPGLGEISQRLTAHAVGYCLSPFGLTASP